MKRKTRSATGTAALLTHKPKSKKVEEEDVDLIQNVVPVSPKCLICREEIVVSISKRTIKRRTEKDQDGFKEIHLFISNCCKGLFLCEDDLLASLPSSTETEMFCNQHKQMVAKGIKLRKMLQNIQLQVEEIEAAIKDGVSKNLALECAKLKEKDLQEPEPLGNMDLDVNDVDFDFCEIDPCAPSENGEGDNEEEPVVKIEMESYCKEEGVHDFEGLDKHGNKSEPESDSSDGDSDWGRKRKKRKWTKKKTKTAKTRQKPAKKKSQPRPMEEKFNRRTTKSRNSPCEICDLNFPSYKERNTHRLAVHGAGPYPELQCEHCGKIFFLKRALYRHMGCLHSEEPCASLRSYKCDECPATLSTLDGFTSHKRLRHTPKGNLPVRCTICNDGKLYKGEYNLKFHVRAFHERGGLKKKSFVCEFCGKSYSDPEEFKKHKAKVHLKTYAPVKCDICSKTLADSRSFKKHKLSQHLKSYQYKCPLCGAGCLYKSHLAAHFKSCHTELSVEEVEELVQKTGKVKNNSTKFPNISTPLGAVNSTELEDISSTAVTEKVQSEENEKVAVSQEIDTSLLGQELVDSAYSLISL